MSPNAHQPSQLELNRNLLQSQFKFKPLSKLKNYVEQKTGNRSKCLYTLAEVLTILKDAIRGEGLYDNNNASVILCSDELEEALNMRALHVTEIRDLVLAQLTRIPGEPQPQPAAPQQPRPAAPQTAAGCAGGVGERLVRTASVSSQVFTDKNAKFTLKPLFLEVVRQVPECNPHQTVFTYEQVTLLLSKYILARKEKFFDQRNIKLAMVENDKIGEAFGVKAFHRCQVNNLLRQQLLPYSRPGPDLGLVNGAGSSGPAGVSVLVTDKPQPAAPTPPLSYPPFPALSKAASLPARKRSGSGERGESRSKQARLVQQEGGCEVVVVSPPTDSDAGTDTETIYSGQGNETRRQEEESSSEEEGRGQEFVEYDPPQSGEDEGERPPQAMGKGEHSSAGDSDTDVEDVRLGGVRGELDRKLASQAGESVYWGDGEADTVEREAGRMGLDHLLLDTQCATCCAKISNHLRYCGDCWRTRKTWCSRPRRGWKKRAVAARLPAPPPASDTETDGAAEERKRQESLASTASQDSGIGSQEFEIVAEPAEEVTTFSKPLLGRSISLELGSSASPAHSSDSGYQSTSQQQVKMCTLCEERPIDSALVHGRLGHQVCCYQCAKKLWRKKPECPLCRRKVSNILKLI